MEITGWNREDEKKRDNWLHFIQASKGIIVGGGGLMEFPKHRPSLDFIGSLGKPAVIWGAGTNSTQASWTMLRPRFASDYSRFSLIGCRDYGYEDKDFVWVPCASCMHPIFDREHEIKRELVFFGNAGMPGYSSFVPVNLQDDAIKFNMKTSIEAVVEFLGSAETVVTSSYHGAYWAMLLGRKVIGIPTSSKFYGFKHAIPLCAIDDWQRFAKLAVRHGEALEECRAANLDFAARVSELLGLTQSNQ